MAWYPAATRMESQPEPDGRPAIRPTRFILDVNAAPWTARRMYEYRRDSEGGALNGYREARHSRYAAAARRSSGLSRSFPRPWLHAVRTRPRTRFPQIPAESGQQP